MVWIYGHPSAAAEPGGVCRCVTQSPLHEHFRQLASHFFCEYQSVFYIDVLYYNQELVASTADSLAHLDKTPKKVLGLRQDRLAERWLAGLQQRPEMVNVEENARHQAFVTLRKGNLAFKDLMRPVS